MDILWINQQARSRTPNLKKTLSTSNENNKKAENLIEQILEIFNKCKNDVKAPGKIDYAIIHQMAATEKYLGKNK